MGRTPVLARPRGGRVAMLLENNAYPQDVRVRLEAEALARAGHQVTVVAPRATGQQSHEMIGGVRVIRFRGVEGKRPLGFLAEYVVAAIRLQVAGFRELLRGAQVLHLHNPPDVLFVIAAIFRAAGRKVIFDHHDLFPETIETKVGSRLLARMAEMCERWTFRVANHVLSTNQSYAEVAFERGGKSPETVTVVRNGPPEDWLQVPSEVRGGTLERVQLGYVGAVSTQDGVEMLAPVLELLAAQGLEASLLVVGEGDARSALETEMRQRGMDGQLTITGWVSWEEVPSLLAQVDICVDPAPATEVNTRSTMIKIAEYLALGKPVVAFDLLETRRTAGSAAVLVPPHEVERFAQAIIELAREPAQRARLASLARQRAAELVWGKSEKALLAAYAAVLR